MELAFTKEIIEVNSDSTGRRCRQKHPANSLERLGSRRGQ